MAIFGNAAAEGAQGGLFQNPLLILLGIILLVYIFAKFCSWAKGFKMSGGVRKLIFILTGVGLVVFNVFYSMGNKAIAADKGWNVATYALVAAMVWVLIFAFALMAETKAE